MRIARARARIAGLLLLGALVPVRFREPKSLAGETPRGKAKRRGESEFPQRRSHDPRLEQSARGKQQRFEEQPEQPEQPEQQLPEQPEPQSPERGEG